MSERVTWLMPVKNGMPYLPATLASIEAQTYRNWEVLVWDNGSTDGTVEELQRWIPSRLPGRVITEHPMSYSQSLTELVNLCETEFAARIDADDINFPNRLEVQVNYLQSHTDVAAVGAQVIRIDENSIEAGQYHNLPCQHEAIVSRLLSLWSMWHPSVLFRKSTVIDVGNYYDEQPCEDYSLWVRLASKYRLANLDIPLLKYRVHATSVTAIALKEDRATSAVKSILEKYGPQLYGCNHKIINRLLYQKHRCAIYAFYKISKHLSKVGKYSTLQRMRSPEFAQTMLMLTSKYDYISKASIFLLNKKIYPFRNLVKDILKSR